MGMSFRVVIVVVCALLAPITQAETVVYEFDISTKTINVTGTDIEALAIDGQIPAPILRAKVGDTLRTTFHNKLDRETSVHWHGILLPADQDGVPYLNTQPIAPGQSHTFEFPITHAGTFWYHSHTNLQIQRGLYGGIILEQAGSESIMQDELILFSDWTDTKVGRVLKNLKSSEEFYTFQRDTVQSWDRVIANGPDAIRNRISSAFTRMGPMDLADVYYDAFLANGKIENEISLINGDTKQIKLRLVNGSTSSYYDVEYAGGAMTVVAADGQDVEPIRVRRLRIATAETYDVLVPVASARAFELRASSFDASGYSSTFIGDGQRILAPDLLKPNLFLMDHSLMDMEMMDHDSMGMDTMDHAEHESDATVSQEMTSDQAPMHNHSQDSQTTGDLDLVIDAGQAQHAGHSANSMPTASPPSLAASASVITEEVIEHMTDYSKLVALTATTLPADQHWREISLTLTGSMERYVWSFDGRTFRESPQIVINKGENVRFQFTNDTMMHHPLHLHGHFFRVVNQAGDRSPLKHTVNVPPMGQVTIEFDANEEQDWLFHCHNQYHMKTGMNRVISYEDTSLLSSTIELNMQTNQRFFQINEFHLMTSFADYEFSVFDERHEFRIELESDLSGANEHYTTYNYHFNRFLSGFAGYQGREQEIEKNRDVAVAGINLTLPFLIGSEWRVDDAGRFRLELESEIQLTKSWALDWRWNTDSEYRYGINYRLNSRWAITIHTDKEYGEGVGVKFFY